MNKPIISATPTGHNNFMRPTQPSQKTKVSEFEISTQTITPQLGIQLGKQPGLSRNQRNLGARFNRTDIAR